MPPSVSAVLSAVSFRLAPSPEIERVDPASQHCLQRRLPFERLRKPPGDLVLRGGEGLKLRVEARGVFAPASCKREIRQDNQCRRDDRHCQNDKAHAHRKLFSTNRSTIAGAKA